MGRKERERFYKTTGEKVSGYENEKFANMNECESSVKARQSNDDTMNMSMVKAHMVYTGTKENNNIMMNVHTVQARLTHIFVKENHGDTTTICIETK